MIGWLAGEVVDRDATSVIVNVAGVGYNVHVPTSLAVPARGQAIELFTSLQVREDSMTLYGFGDRRTLRLFELLLTSSGVGPKLAIATMSALRPDALERALAHGEIATLTQVPGIGKKVAERLVLELQDKVAAAAATPVAVSPDSVTGEVREALHGLGYSVGEVDRVLQQLPERRNGDADVSDVLREALRLLGGTR
ncbi:MAG: Holliday junction branch migration protein RuvA [Nitriliruptoraceae bacterium]